MKTLKWILTALIFLPWVFGLLAILDSSHGLLWIFLETIFYSPIYWLNEPFFNNTEIGWIVTNTGKILGTIFYIALLVGVIAVEKWLLTNKSTVTR